MAALALAGNHVLSEHVEYAHEALPVQTDVDPQASISSLQAQLLESQNSLKAAEDSATVCIQAKAILEEKAVKMKKEIDSLRMSLKEALLVALQAEQREEACEAELMEAGMGPFGMWLLLSDWQQTFATMSIILSIVAFLGPTLFGLVYYSTLGTIVSGLWCTAGLAYYIRGVFVPLNSSSVWLNACIALLSGAATKIGYLTWLLLVIIALWRLYMQMVSLMNYILANAQRGPAIPEDDSGLTKPLLGDDQSVVSDDQGPMPLTVDLPVSPGALLLPPKVKPPPPRPGGAGKGGIAVPPPVGSGSGVGLGGVGAAGPPPGLGSNAQIPLPPQPLNGPAWGPLPKPPNPNKPGW